jgi:hypothetical protein
MLTAHIAQVADPASLVHLEECSDGGCTLGQHLERVWKLVCTPPELGGLRPGWWLIRPDPERKGLIHLELEDPA